MRYDEIWGVSYRRIWEYFAALDGVTQTGEGDFLLNGVSITLVKLADKRLGSLTIPQTRVVLLGDEAVKEIYHSFFLRFLSAGG